MSALGQKRTSAPQQLMSALPLKADISAHDGYVRYGPKADIATRPNDARSKNEMRIIGRLIARDETLSASDHRPSHRPGLLGN
jgi:hypothetical protein